MFSNVLKKNSQMIAVDFQCPLLDFSTAYFFILKLPCYLEMENSSIEKCQKSLTWAWKWWKWFGWYNLIKYSLWSVTFFFFFAFSFLFLFRRHFQNVKNPKEGKNHIHSDLSFSEILVGTFQVYLVILSNIKASEEICSN